NSFDFRAGADGTLYGFNLSFTYGNRQFKDRTNYITQGNIGFNTTPNTGAIATFNRSYPIDGTTNFASLSVQRTFFDKQLDFTGRVIYSLTDRNIGFTELITGRDA